MSKAKEKKMKKNYKVVARYFDGQSWKSPGFQARNLPLLGKGTKFGDW